MLPIYSAKQQVSTNSKMTSYIEQLISRLDSIKLTMHELIDNSRIKYFSNNDSQFVYIAPKNYWDQPTEKEQQFQIKLKQNYSQWVEFFSILTENSPESSKKKIKDVDTFVWNWIEKKSDWGVPRTLPEAKVKFDKEINLFYETLSLYLNSAEKETILIPDTNALLTDPDPNNYKALSGADKFTMIFLPTVLSELDELKIKSSNPEFQKKVKSVISRLKGYRQQGNLIEGVIVEKTIRLKMVASEPNFDKALTWLDRENNDDRIIASALEIQKANPSSIVCIVTADINLQNKAKMANFPYLDIDK